jgi:poly(3-hydroxybutyrate) depolymerase
MAEAGPQRLPAGWAEQVRHAAPAGYLGPWPRLSIWHGSADSVVDPANARLLAEQWSAVHGLERGVIGGEPVDREIWGPPGRPTVELWLLPGVAHVWPANATSHIAGFWQLQQG